MTLTKDRYFLAAVFVSCFIVVAGISAKLFAQRGYEVPFVPTPHSVVQAMLELAETQPDDIVYDLGSGDGRIVVAAVRDIGVRKGVGVDINPERVADGRRNAEEAGVTDRATFVEGNLYEFDFSEATVVTMYLLPSVNLNLRPRILSELRPGTRVVSHQFDMDDWRPDRSVEVDGADVHLWIVPAEVEGTWTWESENGAYHLELAQEFQNVSGRLRGPDGDAAIQNARLSGDQLQFEARIPGAGSAFRFDGKVANDMIAANIEAADTSTVAARRGAPLRPE